MQSVNELTYGNKRYHAHLLHSHINEDGGFTTEVYEARERSDTGVSRDVVLKVYRITAEDKRTQAQLGELIKHEVRLMNKVANEHLASFYDFHTESPTEMCMVIERIGGYTLAQYYEELTALPDTHTMKNLLRVCIAVARTLSDMHQHKPPIAHRDITPANIMVDRRFHTIKLIDFGLAALPPWPNEGTPGYRAPEQSFSGEELSIPSASCDVFGLGAVLYKGLTLKTPNVLPNHPAKPPMDTNPAVPSRLNNVVLEMLAYSPGERPSMREVRAELTKIRNNWASLTTAEPTPAHPHAPNMPEERVPEQAYGEAEHTPRSTTNASAPPQAATPPPQQQAIPPQTTPPSAMNNTPLYDLYNEDLPTPALPPDPPTPHAAPEAIIQNPRVLAPSRLVVGMAILIMLLLFVVIFLLFTR